MNGRRRAQRLALLVGILITLTSTTDLPALEAEVPALEAALPALEMDLSLIMAHMSFAVTGLPVLTGARSFWVTVLGLRVVDVSFAVTRLGLARPLVGFLSVDRGVGFVD